VRAVVDAAKGGAARAGGPASLPAGGRQA